MKPIEYYLEISPQAWSGMRQLHAAGCSLMPEKDLVRPIGRFDRSVKAMSEARRIYRRTHGCYHCCKA